MPKCPNETSTNIYKSHHKMEPHLTLPNGQVYKCTICHATIMVFGGKQK